MRKIFFTTAILIILIIISSIVYFIIGNGKYSLIDCIYMTIITITTIGYGEIIDLSGNPLGRVFTIVIAVTGIGILTYILSNITALIVEGELNKNHRRKKMEKIIAKLSNHYIICCLDDTSFYVVKELKETDRNFVLVDNDIKKINKILEIYKDALYIEGDPADTDILLKAGINSAKGLFAVSEDDKYNLLITITARHINDNIRIVSQCKDIKNLDKIKRSGADSVISPTFIGGLRITSEMVRPTVVTFLDMMLRDKEKNLRIEEIHVPDNYVGKFISSANINKFKNLLLLAVKCSEGWIYNPSHDYILKKNDILIVMTTSEDKNKFEKSLKH